MGATTVVLETVVEVALYGLLFLAGWIAKQVWDKHGPRLAARWGWIERLGLAEAPKKTVRREAQFSVTNIMDDERDDG
jgi:hypothetical protein